MLRTRTLGFQLLLLQVGIVLLTVGLTGVLVVRLQQEQIRDTYRQQVLSVATSVARLPSVIAAYEEADPSTTLQPLAELIRESSGMTFVVITDAEGIRYSHPDPGRIGERVSTDPSTTLRGEVFVGTETGTLGESLRAKVPVRSDDGRVLGAASVGILESQLAADLREDVPVVAAWLAAAALLGAIAAALVTRLVRRRIFGLEPEEIAHLLEAREAMLHGIREGVVAVDERGRIALANDEAVRLLELDADPTGRRAEEILDPALIPLLARDRPVADEAVLAGERLLMVNRTPAQVGGRQVAQVLTLRDRTELVEAMRALHGQRNLAETLRAQAHEFSNRLHVVQGLIELGRHQDAVAYIDRIGAGGRVLTGSLDAVHDAALGALILAKASVARERGARLTLESEGEVADGVGDDLITVLGNLVDNALDAVGPDGRVVVRLAVHDGQVTGVRVDDDGPGIAPEHRERVFEPGMTTKEGAVLSQHGHGIGLAQVARIAQRRGGSASVAGSPLGGARVEVSFREPA